MTLRAHTFGSNRLSPRFAIETSAVLLSSCAGAEDAKKMEFTIERCVKTVHLLVSIPKHKRVHSIMNYRGSSQYFLMSKFEPVRGKE